jgi:hypothetical protein
MPAPDYKPQVPAEIREFLARPLSPEERQHSDLRAHLKRIEDKVDALAAALVKPESSVILVGEDIARIAAELRNGARPPMGDALHQVSGPARAMGMGYGD